MTPASLYHGSATRIDNPPTDVIVRDKERRAPLLATLTSENQKRGRNLRQFSA